MLTEFHRIYDLPSFSGAVVTVSERMGNFSREPFEEKKSSTEIRGDRLLCRTDNSDASVCVCLTHL